MNLFDSGGAVFSPCGKYRYRLWRSWASGSGTVNFLMLNPSTADESANDPTVERCEQRARAWGFSRLIVTNLFAWRDTSPEAMKAAAEPVGAGNDAAILEAARESDRVICAWGVHGLHLGRSAAVLQMLACIDLWALRLTSEGQPSHPLYLAYGLQPIPYYVTSNTALSGAFWPLK